MDQAMVESIEMSQRRTGPNGLGSRASAGLATLMLCLALCGCQSLTNPLLDGIPARKLPAEYLGESREARVPIPLSLLRQKQPDEYRIDSGDVLGIYVERIIPIARRDDPTPIPPVNVPPPGDPNQTPSVGLPVVVREGKLFLPLLPNPLEVKGKTLGQIQDDVRAAYEKAEIIREPKGENRAQVFVTLYRPRRYHILVVREDSTAAGNATTGGLFGIQSVGAAAGVSGRGTGNALDLPAYENDVMNALTRSGGLPGFDAADEVIIERGSLKSDDDPAAVTARVQKCYGDGAAGDGSEFGGNVLRIPLRMRRGERPSFTEKDIILQTGDIVFVKTRNLEVFYVGGILFTGQYQIPRDYDLGVIEAVAVTRGSIINGGISALNNLSGQTSNTGIGSPNPTAVSIIRRLPHGQQVVIEVDLNRALRDPRENIFIQPKDFIVLQYTPGEALVRYFTEVLRFNFLATLVNQRDLQGTAALTFP